MDLISLLTYAHIGKRSTSSTTYLLRWQPPPLVSKGGVGHRISLSLLNEYAFRFLYDNIVFHYMKETACQSPTLERKMEMATTSLLEKERDVPPHEGGGGIPISLSEQGGGGIPISLS